MGATTLTLTVQPALGLTPVVSVTSEAVKGPSPATASRSQTGRGRSCGRLDHELALSILVNPDEAVGLVNYAAGWTRRVYFDTDWNTLCHRVRGTAFRRSQHPKTVFGRKNQNRGPCRQSTTLLSKLPRVLRRGAGNHSVIFFRPASACSIVISMGRTACENRRALTVQGATFSQIKQDEAKFCWQVYWASGWLTRP